MAFYREPDETTLDLARACINTITSREGGHRVFAVTIGGVAYRSRGKQTQLVFMRTVRSCGDDAEAEAEQRDIAARWARYAVTGEWEELP